MKLFWRVAGGLAALAVAAWLTIGLYDAVLAKRGTERLEQALATQQLGGPVARSAERDLDRATLLNPDRRTQSYRAQVLAALGRRQEARELALRVTREEPDNMEIWRTVQAIALTLEDRALVNESARRMRELNPRAR